MKPIRLLPLLSRCGLMLWGGGLLPAADWQSLLGNSPFGQSAPGPAASTPDEIEFRGVVQEDGLYLVNLFNPATKTSQWVQVNGGAPGLEVKAYDAAADKVRVTLGGRDLVLTLKQAKVALVKAAPPPPPQAAAPVANAEPGEHEDHPEPGNRAERRAEIRDMIRARIQNGEDPATVFRTLPPDVQARIDELRRRRAGNGGNGGEQPAPPRERH